MAANNGVTFECTLLEPGKALATVTCPPAAAERPPRTEVFVIDVSGSMGVAATVNEGGVQRDTGQTILQLVGGRFPHPRPRLLAPLHNRPSHHMRTHTKFARYI